MSVLFAIVFLFYSNLLMAAPQLSRQWSRSTLLTDHVKFRHFNKMSPLLTKKLVIQGNAIDGVKAFYRNSGHQAWEIPLKNGVEGGAALDGEKLYFGSNNGKFYCVNVTSGQILWTFDLNSESLARPLVKGPYVYHVTGNNTLYAFDKNSGASIWVKANAAKSNMTIRGQTAPVFSDGALYLGFSDGSFTAVNAQNGRELWSKRIGDDKKFNDVDATVVVTNKCLLVSSFSNALYCLNKKNGAINWRHDEGGYNAVYADQDKIYYPTASGEIHLLDLNSGKLLKKIVNIKGISTEIVGVGNYILHGESSGAVVLRDKQSLEKVDQFFPGMGLFAKPSVDQKGKEVYFMSNQANLFRFDLRVEPNSSFMWSHLNVDTK